MIFYFGSMFSIVVQAYLKYPDNERVKNYAEKIFEVFIKEKKAQSLEKYKDIQFIFLDDLQKNPKIKRVVQLVSNELYENEADIGKYLKKHV